MDISGCHGNGFKLGLCTSGVVFIIGCHGNHFILGSLSNDKSIVFNKNFIEKKF